MNEKQQEQYRKEFRKAVLKFLENSKKDMEKIGYVPTLELLIETLKIEKHNENI